jgi:hypothetical protein
LTFPGAVELVRTLLDYVNVIHRSSRVTDKAPYLVLSSQRGQAEQCGSILFAFVFGSTTQHEKPLSRVPQPTEEQLLQMWETCIFAFDANVFLNIYEYTGSTREELLRVLEQRKDRI